MKRVGAFVGAVFASLCKTGDFFGACLFPQSFVFTFEKVSVLFKFSGIGVENGIELVKGVDLGIGSTLDFGVNQLLELGR